MKDAYFWRQLDKIFKASIKYEDYETDEQLTKRANKLVTILKDTYQEGYRRGALEGLSHSYNKRES